MSFFFISQCFETDTMERSKANLHFWRANELLEECTAKSRIKANKHIQRARELELEYGTKPATAWDGSEETVQQSEGLVERERLSLVKRMNSKKNDGADRYSEKTKGLVYTERKSYLQKVVENLLKAAELCEEFPITMWLSHSYATRKKDWKEAYNGHRYFEPGIRIIPGSCISDLIHDSIANPGRCKDYISIIVNNKSETNADMFIANSTRRIHRIIRSGTLRYQFDNTQFRGYSMYPFEHRSDKSYEFEKDTSLETHLRQVLIVCMSMFVLCAQHCSKCECKGLEYTCAYTTNGKTFRDVQLNRFLYPDLPWNKHDCVHLQNFNEMLHKFNMEHMAHVGIPQRGKLDKTSLFQLPRRSCKFLRFESTIAISSTLALLSCDSCEENLEMQTARDHVRYVFPAIGKKPFQDYVLSRQDDAKYSSSAHWAKTLEDTQKCIDVIYHVAKSMYYLRFFLKGHEGTAKGTIWYPKPNSDSRHKKGKVVLKQRMHRVSREAVVECEELKPHHPTIVENIKKYEKEYKKTLLKILEIGRIPEGELNFCEIDTINESDIYKELAQKTKSIFDSDPDSDIQFELASKAAKEIMKHHHQNCTDVQQKLLTDIVERILIFGSALYAYGLLDRIKSKFSLWARVKERIQNAKSQIKKGKVGEWMCA